MAPYLGGAAREEDGFQHLFSDLLAEVANQVMLAQAPEVSERHRAHRSPVRATVVHWRPDRTSQGQAFSKGSPCKAVLWLPCDLFWRIDQYIRRQTRPDCLVDLANALRERPFRRVRHDRQQVDIRKAIGGFPGAGPKEN